MIMKKYIFLIVTVVCLFACKDGDEVRQTTSPEASFSIVSQCNLNCLFCMNNCCIKYRDQDI